MSEEMEEVPENDIATIIIFRGSADDRSRETFCFARSTGIGASRGGPPKGAPSLCAYEVERDGEKIIEWDGMSHRVSSHYRPDTIPADVEALAERALNSAPEGAPTMEEASERIEREKDATFAALFAALRAHRQVLADEMSLPKGSIASDRTLREVAMLRPTKLKTLNYAYGLGPAKIAKYGAGILEVVRRVGDGRCAGSPHAVATVAAEEQGCS